MPNAISRLAVGFFLAGRLILLAQTSVLTQHNDLARTGQNLNETILTPASISSGRFGKLFTLPVDGLVAAQPLYLPNLKVGGTAHNVVFIATEHDSVFAFDADTGGSPLWQASLLDAAHGAASGATTDPDTNTGCYATNGEYGITGTPVIDPSTGTLYVVALTFENNYELLRLHALDVTSGQEKFGSPAAITATLPGTGNGSSGGNLAFDAKWENQRAGLALVNGTIYIPFAAHCDFADYHGWLFAYSAANLSQTGVFLASPNGVDSGMWMGGAAPAADTSNGTTRLFLVTGNGTYDATNPYATNTVDYGDDILRFDLTGGLNVADSFTPFNQANLSSGDLDLGSGGTLLLPDQPGAYPHLLVVASKGGPIYLVNRDNLGGYSTTGNNVVQEIDGQAASSFGLPAYWNGSLYLWAPDAPLKQFAIGNGLLSTSPIAVSNEMQGNGLGSTPSISANANTAGIVWSIDASQTPEVVYAHDAINVANTLWSSAMNASRDAAGVPVKFAVPTVANGKVYVISNKAVSVYGLPDFSFSAAGANIQQGTSVASPLTVTPLFGFNGTVNFSASNLPSGVTAAFSSSTVTFTSTLSAAPGTYGVTLTGASGTQAHSVGVSLVVTAAPDYSLSPSVTSLSLSPGTSGTATILVTPSASFTGNVTFTCSIAAALANVSCSIPGSVMASGAATLTITAASQATLPWWRRVPKPPWEILCALLGLISTINLISKRPRNSFALGFLLLVFVGFVGCGGSGSTPAVTTSITGPAETGMITVTGTSGSLSHTTAISVTVQ